MNKRIEKVREDIRLTEDKIREMNEYLKTLKAKEKRLCDDEILKTMRDMAGKGGDVMELLSRIQGTKKTESDIKAADRIQEIPVAKEDDENED